MDEIVVVEILRKVLTVNQKDKIPLNSIQKSKKMHKVSVKANPVIAQPPRNMRPPIPEPQPYNTIQLRKLGTVLFTT